MTPLERYGLLALVGIVSLGLRLRAGTITLSYVGLLLAASAAAAFYLGNLALPMTIAERAFIAFLPAIIAEDLSSFTLSLPIVIGSAAIPLGLALTSAPLNVSLSWGAIALVASIALVLSLKAPIADAIVLGTAVFVWHVPAVIATVATLTILLLAYLVLHKRRIPFAGAIAALCLCVTYTAPGLLL
jgi:hypothetical protein